MVRKVFYAALVTVAFSFLTQTVSAQGHLFQQYSTQGANSVNADMYPAPHRVPAHVGSSYYTYQPLQPHEMMYQHARNYYNYQGNGHLNKTTVVWQANGNHMRPFPLSSKRLSELSYKWNAYKYCLQSGGTDCGSIGGGHFGGGGHFSGGGGHFGGGGGGGHFGGQLRGHLKSKFQNHFGALGGGCASGQCAASSDFYGDGGYQLDGGSFDQGIIQSAPASGGCLGGCSAAVAPQTQNAQVARSVLENGPVTTNFSDESISR